jgi:hypothetical protein
MTENPKSLPWAIILGHSGPGREDWQSTASNKIEKLMEGGGTGFRRLMLVLRNGGRKCAGNLVLSAPHRKQELLVLRSGTCSAKVFVEIGTANGKLPGPYEARALNHNVPEHKYQAQNAPLKHFHQFSETLAAISLRKGIAGTTPTCAIRK